MSEPVDLLPKEYRTPSLLSLPERLQAVVVDNIFKRFKLASPGTYWIVGKFQVRHWDSYSDWWTYQDKEESMTFSINPGTTKDAYATIVETFKNKIRKSAHLYGAHSVDFTVKKK